MGWDCLDLAGHFGSIRWLSSLPNRLKDGLARPHWQPEFLQVSLSQLWRVGEP